MFLLSIISEYYRDLIRQFRYQFLHVQPLINFSLKKIEGLVKMRVQHLFRRMPLLIDYEKEYFF